MSANKQKKAARVSVLKGLKKKMRWRNYCLDEGYLHRKSGGVK